MLTSRPAPRSIQIAVVWATPQVQDVVSITINAGATVGDAIDCSGLLATYDLDLTALAFGIFGRRCSLDTAVKPGDRIELYRPLEIDPKEARRQRAHRKQR